MRRVAAFFSGFLSSSLFEDAIRNRCEGLVPQAWLWFFAGGIVLCAAMALRRR